MKKTKKSLFFVIVISISLILFPSLASSDQTPFAAAPRKEPAPSVKGFCCTKGQLVSATQGECRQKKGYYYQTQAEARKHCQADKVFCCIAGKVSQLNAEQCRKHKGVAYRTGEEAQRTCKAEKIYCCLQGKIQKTTIEVCRRSKGQGYRSLSEAQRKCKPEEVYCCLQGKIKKTSTGECRKNKGQGYITLSEAQRKCKPEKVYCCLKGTVNRLSADQCKKKKGKAYIRESEARRNCGWCCAENKVFPAASVLCSRKRGDYFTTRTQAERHCKEQAKCCIKGKVFSYTQGECDRKKGIYYRSYKEAKRQCQVDRSQLPLMRQQGPGKDQAGLEKVDPSSQPTHAPPRAQEGGAGFEVHTPIAPSLASGVLGAVDAGVLTVAVDGSTPASAMIPRVAHGVPYTVWSLEGSDDESISVEELTVTRVGLGMPEDFTALRLYVGGVQYGSQKTVNMTTNSAVFSLAAEPMEIPAGEKLLVTVVGDMEAGENAENAICLQVPDDIVAYGTLFGGPVLVNGTFPACGAYMYTTSTVIGTEVLGRDLPPDDGQPSDYLRPTISDPDYLRPHIPDSSSVPPPPDPPPPPPEPLTLSPILLEATAFYDAKGNQANSFRVTSCQFAVVSDPDSNQRYIAAALFFNRDVDVATVVENVNLRLLKQNEGTIFWNDASTQDNVVRVRNNVITWLSGAPVANGHYKMHLRGTLKSEDDLFLDCDGDGVGEGGALPAYESQVYQIEEPALEIIEGGPGGVMLDGF